MLKHYVGGICMSNYGNNQRCYEKSTRPCIELIKLRVTVGLFFFKKIEIEKEEKEVTGFMEKELTEWCILKGYKFSVKKVELPRYIKGHAVYLLHDTRHCKKLSFSR